MHPGQNTSSKGDVRCRRRERPSGPRTPNSRFDGPQSHVPPAPVRDVNGPFGPKVGIMGRALTYFREVAKETDNGLVRALTLDNGLVRALALEREFICDALRFPFTPYEPMVEGSRAPKVPPRGIKRALRFIRRLSRVTVTP